MLYIKCLVLEQSLKGCCLKLWGAKMGLKPEMKNSVWTHSLLLLQPTTIIRTLLQTCSFGATGSHR